MKIHIKGLPLVMNTINNLQPLQKAWISHTAMMITKDNEIYLYKNAQFASISFDSYFIPIEKDSEGNITIDFTEVGLAFNVHTEKELSKYNKDDWYIIPGIQTEIQTQDTDWLKRMKLADAFETFNDHLIDEVYPLESLICLKDTIIARLFTCVERDGIEEIILYCKKDHSLSFKKQHEDKAIDETTLSKICGQLEAVSPYLREIQKAAELRLEKLPKGKRTEAAMQLELNKALEEEDYIKAGEIRDEMRENGFTPIN